MRRKAETGVGRRDFLKISATGAMAAGAAWPNLEAGGIELDNPPTKSPMGLRFRQVHLDFHTSEHIPDVGARFDPEDFAATLFTGVTVCRSRPSQTAPMRSHLIT